MQLVLLLTRIWPIDNCRTRSITLARRSKFSPTSIPKSDHRFLLLVPLFWESCKTMSRPSIPMLLIVSEYWHRYSNTLFASLNNRLYIRKISSDRGALPTSRAPAPSTSKVPLSSVHVELEVTTRRSSEEMTKGGDV